MQLIDDCYVCSDCLVFIANGDLSGLDNDPDTADGREAEIIAGIEKEAEAGGHWVGGDSEKDHEFSRSSCDCCGTSVEGSRHQAAVIYHD